MLYDNKAYLGEVDFGTGAGGSASSTAIQLNTTSSADVDYDLGTGNPLVVACVVTEAAAGGTLYNVALQGSTAAAATTWYTIGQMEFAAAANLPLGKVFEVAISGAHEYENFRFEVTWTGTSTAGKAKGWITTPGGAGTGGTTTPDRSFA